MYTQALRNINEERRLLNHTWDSYLTEFDNLYLQSKQLYGNELLDKIELKLKEAQFENVDFEDCIFEIELSFFNNSTKLAKADIFINDIQLLIFYNFKRSIRNDQT